MPRRSSQAANDPIRSATIGFAFVLISLGPALAENAVVPDLPAQLGLRGSVDSPLQLEVFINGRTRKIIAEFRRLPDGAFAATRSELNDAGLKPPDGRSDELLKLDNIPALRFRYDELKQAIYFDAPDNLVAPQSYFASKVARPTTPATSDWGATLNYDAFAASADWSWNRQMQFGGASLSLDGRIFSPVGILTQSGILGTTALSQKSGLRLDTGWQYLDDATQMSYRAGDTANSGLPWTRPIRIGGLQVQHDFALRPDLVTSPTPTASGTAALPSTVDVYVNNYKVFTQDVEPGPFRVEDLPAISSNGSTSVVLHDVTGREVTQTLPFFVSSRLLRRGVYDYSVEAGYPRTFYGVESFSYGRDPVASASLRMGLNDWLTVESHAEGGAGLENGGAGIAVDAIDRGVIEAAIAGSHFSGGSGLQIALGGTTAFRGIVADAQTQRTFGAYGDLAMITTPHNGASSTLATLLHYSAIQSYGAPIVLLTSVNPPRALDRISISVPEVFHSATALNLSFVNLEQTDGEKSQIATAGLARNFRNGASLFANAYVDLAHRKDAGVFLGLSMSLGGSLSATTAANIQHNNSSISAEIAKPAELEPGSYGWHVYDNEGANRYSSADATYQSQVGRAIVATNQYGWNKSAAASANADFAGSVSALGGSVKLGPTVTDSLVLVDAGAPGVKVLEDNRPVGVTDQFGQLLVPGLRGFQDNKISIDPNSLPLNAQTGVTEAVVNPKSRAGVVVDFKVATNAHDAEVILKDANGAVIPTGARVEGADGKSVAVVGYDGRAYLSDLHAENTFLVRADKLVCTARFEYAAVSGRVRPTIGPVVCR